VSFIKKGRGIGEVAYTCNPNSLGGGDGRSEVDSRLALQEVGEGSITHCLKNN
jgi:hypothetical protein